MGINLAAVSYFASEQPFINAFLESQRWITHSDATWDTNEEQYINLDANGWPITLTSINEPSATNSIPWGYYFFKVCQAHRTVFIQVVSTLCCTTGKEL